MSGRTVRRFVEGLRRGRSTEPARPDDLEAQEMKTAIELRAARLGSDSPREEFVTDLHRRLADAMDETNTPKPPTRWARPAPVGRSSSAQASPLRQRPPESWSVATVLAGNNEPSTTPSAHGVLEPNAGAWRAVGASVDLPDGGALAFDLGSVSGFVHRADTRLEAVSGVCTHQGVVAGRARATAALPVPFDVANAVPDWGFIGRRHNRLRVHGVV